MRMLGFLAGLLLLVTAPLTGGEDMVFNGIFRVYAAGQGDHGVYPGGWGGSQVRAVTLDGAPAVEFRHEKPHQFCMFAFNGHQPVKAGAWPKGTVARVTLRAPEDREVRLACGWRLKGGDAAPAGAPVAAALKAGAWTTLDLVYPEIPEAGGYGLFLADEVGGVLEIREVVIGNYGKVALAPVDYHVLRLNDTLTLKGLAAPGIARVTVEAAAAARDGGARVGSFTAPVKDGAWTLTLKRDQLRPYCANVLTAVVDGGRSAPAEVFVYPAVQGRKLPAVTNVNGRLMCEGRPFSFVGLNYTNFQMPLCRNADHEMLARSVGRLRDWKINFVRVTLTLSMFQPAEGVFPDSPEYAKTLAKYSVNQEFIQMFDRFLQMLADSGIYAAMDWHEMPTDPYRYFTGADPQDSRHEKPGTAIAWLCDDLKKGVDWDLSNPRHLKALLTTHTWLAKHLAKFSNVIGFEVPYNEPHRQWESNQANWTRVTSAAAFAVKQGCPRMLTFTQNPNFAHNTEGWAFTWLDPQGIDGQAPHHYIANGPVAVRPDAKQREMPWLARDPDRIFAVSMPSLYFPLMVWAHPMYNGEGGEHGARSFLPDMEVKLAEDYMYEASLAQCYAAGLSGHVNWTMLDDPNCNFEIFAKHAPRYARVMAAGPVDWSRADLAVIQNTEAVPSGNGHNYACVPFVDLALGLHLGPVHYLTDDYLIFNGLSRLAAGFEQAGGNTLDFGPYKALVVDRRNLDGRIANLVKGLKIPVLWVDDMAALTAADLAAFLRQAKIPCDDRTPFGLQIAVGPRHVVLYCRAGEGGKMRVYPRIAKDGQLKLVDEQGKTVFAGTAAALAEQGMEINLPKWRSMILEIQ